jgi:hypothetical protein
VEDASAHDCDGDGDPDKAEDEGEGELFLEGDTAAPKDPDGETDDWGEDRWSANKLLLAQK